MEEVIKKTFFEFENSLIFWGVDEKGSDAESPDANIFQY